MWTFEMLAAKLALDATSASVTALAVAPLVAAFDEAITRSASGEPLWTALGKRLVGIMSKPAEFFASTAFVWMWIVYAATYLTSNALKSIESATSIRLGFLATVCVTLVNMSCGIAKDAAFAKMFSKGEGKTTPLTAYVTWFLRDLVAFTFILTMPPTIKRTFGFPEDLAKFMAPILGQYFTTPLAAPPRLQYVQHALRVAKPAASRLRRRLSLCYDGAADANHTAVLDWRLDQQQDASGRAAAHEQLDFEGGGVMERGRTSCAM